MKMKKKFSAALSGVMALSLAFSGVSYAAETDSDTSKYQNPVYDADTDTTTWDYVYYGSYPSSEVTGTALTEAIEKAEYDVNDVAVVDGVKYKRLSADTAKYTPARSLRTKEGEFYSWGEEEFHYFKFEPIKWRVLEVKEDSETGKEELLLFSDKALDCGSYLEMDNHKMNWYISNMRSWLNEYPGTMNGNGTDYKTFGGFLSMAFTEEEQAAMIAKPVITEDNLFWGTSVNGMPGDFVGESEYSDKLFFLSAKEATNESYGFAPDEMTPSKTRQLKMTDYAFANGGWAGTEGDLQGNCWWMLRTPGDHERKVALGYRDGRVYMEGWNAGKSIPYYCVAPACYVDADSEFIKEAPAEEAVIPAEPTGPAVNPTEPTGPAVNPGETTGSAVTPESVRPNGDVNNDGVVTLADAQKVLRIALLLDDATEEEKYYADADSVNNVTLTDAQAVLRAALLLGTLPEKAPFGVVTGPAVEVTEPAADVETTGSALTQPEDVANGTVWIAGDSIAAQHEVTDESHTRGTIGWGVIIGEFFDDTVKVNNTALSSRSAQSFTKEANYKLITSNIKAGDYLFISFGHNDEFPVVGRHTDPYGSSADEGSYKWYLKNYYIDMAIEKGAIPVLVSSVVERNFVNGKFNYQFHSVYKTAMEELVAEYKEQGIEIAYIDLHTKMNDLYTELGDYQTSLLHAQYKAKDSDNREIVVVDNTHFTLAGAKYAVKYICEGLEKLDMDIMKYAKKDLLAVLENIPTPKTFKISTLKEQLFAQKNNSEEPEEPEVPDVSGDAVVPSTGDAVTGDAVTGGTVVVPTGDAVVVPTGDAVVPSTGGAVVPSTAEAVVPGTTGDVVKPEISGEALKHED